MQYSMEAEQKGVIWALVIVAVIVLSLFSSLLTIPKVASAYTPHAPIVIDSNGNFTAANGVTGGNGTATSPHIIEGWEINTSSDIGINIKNTDVHFVVRDSWIYGDTGHAGISLMNVTNGRIENVIVERCANGIQLLSSHYNIIANNTVRDSWQEGIFLITSSNNTIIDNTAIGNGFGFKLSGSNDNTIERNNASDNLFDGFRFDSSDWSVIVDNTAMGNGRSGIYLASSSSRNLLANNTPSWNNISGIYLSFSSSNLIRNNLISFNEYEGITLSASIDTRVIENTMEGNGIVLEGEQLEYWNTHFIDTSNTINGKPVRYWRNVTGGTVPLGAGQVILANCTGVTVRNQNVSNGSSGIQLGFSPDNVITGNTAFQNRWSGILLHVSNNVTVYDNAISANSYGIEAYRSRHNNIRDNVILDSDTGIYLYYSDNNSITGNAVSNSSYVGILLSGSVGNLFSGNIVCLNDYYGFVLFLSDKNMIAYNNVSWNNDTGILLSASVNNLVHHNDIMNNTLQASDNNATNQWDDGYPSGGNYWSNYTGIDNCSGPNQDICPDPDHIGDTPYVIDADSQDRYPLMSPLGIVHARPPTVLQANLNDEDFKNVTLKWLLSPDDGLGFRTIKGYEIHRDSTYDPDGSGYQLIASLPNGTSEFTDSFAGEGDPNNYFYRICAVDLNNNTSCALNQAGKFTRSLSEGPSLVSIPLIQSNDSIETVLQTVRWDKAWSYNSSIQKWKWHMKFKPYSGELARVNLSMGLWINVTEQSNLTVAGIVPSTIAIHLRGGWNLVGFPSFQQDYTVGDLKVAVAPERTEEFDASVPPYFLRVPTDGDTLQTGFGYWIRLENDTVWIVEIS